MEAAQFLRGLIEAVPYRVHTVLTDNGVQFAPRKQDIWDSQHILRQPRRAPVAPAALPGRVQPHSPAQAPARADGTKRQRLTTSSGVGDR